MRRKLLAGAVAGGLAVGGSYFFFSHSEAQSGPAQSEQPKAVAGELPIAQVILFSSGVGYFQREGEVQGNARIDLSFPVQDINDLIKSMVLSDLGGGHVSAVSYESQAPIDKTLRSFAINLTNNPSFGQILNQARGEKVEAVLQQGTTTQPGTMTGVIMGVEKKKEAVGKDAVENEFVNLWCAEGMRSVKLGDVQRVRFLNPVMDSEVKKALEVLSLSHDTQKKSVSLAFSGEGKREVRVGYVIENPIWKTSYRLVLDEKGKPFLQGWAVVENTQDEDWNNVRMSLVSGRPISFQMNLYQPLFVSRPVVEPELFASLRPPTYNGAMEKQAEQLAAADADFAPKAEARSLKERDFARNALANAPGGGGGGANGKRAEPLDPRKGVSSVANATELGDFYQYKINNPVSLARQKSALLPIVNQPVDGEKVSIYNQSVQAKFPLLGLKFRNSTSLHLMQGPITVFDNNSYAGDARILDLQPKEERLISYAIDLGTEVEPIVNHKPEQITKVKITRGIVETTRRIREEKIYNMKNRSEHDRVVLVEHPYRQDFKLYETAEPSERARDVYRFEVPVAAHKDNKLTVKEERDVQQTVALSNSDDNTLRFFINQGVTSEKVKTAIEKAITLKSKLVATQQELGDKQRRLREINADQGRLRANLKEVPVDSEPYKRYLKKLNEQEIELDKIEQDTKKLHETEFAQRRSFEDYLANLNVD